jgi:adenylate cyclase, class 2
VPRNIEIKLRYEELSAVRRWALNAGARDAGVLVQTDTFYRSARGRLKLRDIEHDHAELIWYDRADLAGVKQSDYIVTPVADVASMHAALDRAAGTRGQVRKRRELLLWRNVRIHLDDVEGLGRFVELESVVGEVDEPTAALNLQALLGHLGLAAAQSVEVAYADLLGL